MRSLLAIAIVLSACGSGARIGAGAGWTCTPFSNRPIAPLSIPTVGAEVTVRVDSTFDCKESGATATVSLVDPRNLAVEVARVLVVDHEPLIGGAQHLAAYVTFTPSMAGQYHLTVRFEPSIDLQQRDVVVAADLRDAGVDRQFDVHSAVGDCTYLEEMDDGDLLCLGPHVSTHDSLGGLKQLFAQRGVGGRVGTAIWIFNDATRELRRCRKTTGDWDCSSGGSLTFGNAWLLLPNVDDTFVLAQNSADAWLVTTDGGALASKAVSLSSKPVDPVAAFRQGEALWWTSSMTLCGVIGAGDITLNCGAADAGRSTTGLAVDESGAWTMELHTSVPTVERVTTTDRQALPLPYATTYSMSEEFSWGSTAHFDVDGAHFRVRYRGGTLELDRLPDRGSVMNATASSFVLRDNDSLLLYHR